MMGAGLRLCNPSFQESKGETKMTFTKFVTISDAKRLYLMDVMAIFLDSIGVGKVSPSERSDKKKLQWKNGFVYIFLRCVLLIVLITSYSYVALLHV